MLLAAFDLFESVPLVLGGTLTVGGEATLTAGGDTELNEDKLKTAISAGKNTIYSKIN